MDYFVSNDLFELPNAQEHYSEQLFLLHGLGTLAYYYRPVAPTTLKDRSAFSLPTDANLYICPQTLFKLHPDFDLMLAEILRADPRARLLLVQATNRQWTALLKARFQRVMPDVTDRIVFMPTMKHDDFINLIAISNVMLDTPHFNGMNSSLEGFSVGTPIVTMPTEFQRGRHTYGMYRRMELTDCIATNTEDYVRIAVKLGTEPDYRQLIREKILSRNHVLFQDVAVVQEFERFFLEAIDRAKREAATAVRPIST